MTEKTFPVLWPYDRDEAEQLQALGCPRRVPWSLVEPHFRQTMENHGQTLTRLAERGGLSPSELVAVLDGHGMRWVQVTHDAAAVPRLVELLEAHDPNGQLGVYRRGWTDGAAFLGAQSTEPRYLRGYKNGRAALDAAMAVERARLVLKHNVTTPDDCDACALGLHKEGGSDAV